MHGKHNTRREQSPTHNGTHSGPIGLNKTALYGSMAMAALGASCTTSPSQNQPYFHPAPHAIQMSPTTLWIAINQAHQENKPQMAIEALVAYARSCKNLLSPHEVAYLRRELNKARAYGGKLSRDEEHLMTLLLYWQEKTLPEVDVSVLYDGTV